MIKIGIIGDLMVDIYTHYDCTRVSPEAPVPVLTNSKTKKCLGGAANVAKNLSEYDNFDLNIFGTSAKYISHLEHLNVKPNELDFNNLRTILSSGSPLVEEIYEFVDSVNPEKNYSNNHYHAKDPEYFKINEYYVQKNLNFSSI